MNHRANKMKRESLWEVGRDREARHQLRPSLTDSQHGEWSIVRREHLGLAPAVDQRNIV